MRFPSLTHTAGCLLWLVAACTTPSQLGMPGRSTAPRHSRSDAPLPKTPAKTPKWQHFAESREWPVVARFTTHSHPGQAPWAEVRVTPAQAQAYSELTRGQQLPEGTSVLISFSQEPGAPVLRHFSAQKHERGWDYRVLSTAGAVEAADTALCQRCHAEARSDGLFGIPLVP